MRKFDTKIQYLKYKVLREVARYGFEDNLDAAYYEIPKLIVKEKPTMRCCIYKERAIVEERIKLAMGGDKKNPNVIEVIEIACDECPVMSSQSPAAVVLHTAARTYAAAAPSRLMSSRRRTSISRSA